MEHYGALIVKIIFYIVKYSLKMISGSYYSYTAYNIQNRDIYGECNIYIIFNFK